MIFGESCRPLVMIVYDDVCELLVSQLLQERDEVYGFVGDLGQCHIPLKIRRRYVACGIP